MTSLALRIWLAAWLRYFIRLLNVPAEPVAAPESTRQLEPVEKIVEVERIVEVEKPVTVTVEKIVEKPVTVTVEKFIDKIVEKVVYQTAPPPPPDPLLLAARAVVKVVAAHKFRLPLRHTSLMRNLLATKLMRQKFPSPHIKTCQLKCAIEAALCEAK
jgi:hypothetical protein